MLTEEALKYLRSLEGVTTVEHGDDRKSASRVVAIPEGSTIKSLEEFQPAPNRIKHTAQLAASESFIEYVNRFKGPNTSVYLQLEGQASFTAAIDHHGPNEPSWNTHRASFAPKFSLEWKAWKELHVDGPFNQTELVAFIENHNSDLSDPKPSVMLTAVQKFEAVEKHVYQSAVNLDNGNVQLTYTKDGGQRKVEFPHTLKLWIPVLENEEARFIEGRLRYRTLEGSVAFTFQLKEDPERVEREALREIAGNIRRGCDGCHLYEGAPR